MAFSLNPSIHHIPVDETAVTGIFRSAQPQVPATGQTQGHPCELYICTARDNRQVQAYIALLDTTTHLPLIYTSACDVRDDAKVSALLDEAKTFAAAMGFAVEPVNLDYSIAMRQVIIRGLPVMRPPRRYGAYIARPAAAPAEGEAQATGSADREEPPAAAAETAAAERAAEISMLNAELNRLRHELAGTSSVLRDLQRIREAREGIIEELRSCLQERDDALCAEHELRITREEESAAAVERMQSELAALAFQLEEQRQAFSTLDNERRRLTDQLQQQAAAGTEARQATAVWHKERQQLQRQLRESEKARQAAEQKLAALQQERDALEAGHTLEQQRFRQDLESLQLRLERVTTEKKVCEAMAAGLRKKAGHAVEKLRREKSDLELRLKEHAEQVRHAPAKRQRTPEQRQTAHTAPPAAASPFDGLLSAGSSPGPGPGRTGNAEPLSFQYAAGQPTVSCDAMDELVDYVRSCNTIQAAPFGRASQACSAAICGFMQNGVYSCHLVWLPGESGEALFCRPEAAAADAVGREQVIQDAIYYFESVGFMMEQVQISRDLQQYFRTLERSGICSLREIETAV